MSAQYDFYKNPEPGRKSQRPRLHARIVSNGTTDTETLAKDIHARCTLTTADVMAVLTSLSHVLVERLKDGERVYLKGLGYFQMTLQCPPVRSEKEIRAESIRFKSVAFRPEKDLKDELSVTRFERVKIKRHSKTHTEEEETTLLTDYFGIHNTLSRQDFQHLMNYTESTASRKLRQLVKDGKLRKEGLFRFPVYAPNEGCFGRKE